MNSIELRQRIDSTQNEIATKQSRLAMIPNEKQRCIISDEKRLVLLEKEESELPTQIVRLQERVRLLVIEIEGALKLEAGVRREALAQEREGIAAKVGEETKEVRQMMGAVLQKTRGAQEVWGAYAELGGEDEYLRVKHSGLPLQEAQPPDRITREEITRFIHDLEQSLRHETASASRWTALTTELLRERDQREAQTRHDTEPLTPSEQMVRERQVQQDFLNSVQRSRERDSVAAAKAYNDKIDERTNVRTH